MNTCVKNTIHGRGEGCSKVNAREQMKMCSCKRPARKRGENRREKEQTRKNIIQRYHYSQYRGSIHHEHGHNYSCICTRLHPYRYDISTPKITSAGNIIIVCINQRVELFHIAHSCTRHQDRSQFRTQQCNCYI